jgi:hypothetical protein
MSFEDDGIRNPDGSFTLAYLAYLVNTARRKKRRKLLTTSDPNVLAGSPWLAGDANTTLSIANGRARATIGAGSNPRIAKHVTGLVIGRTYMITGNTYHGTETGNTIVRVSTALNLPSGDIFSGPAPYVINNGWVCNASDVYVGMVTVTSGTGQYAEITENLSMVRIN